MKLTRCDSAIIVDQFDMQTVGPRGSTSTQEVCLLEQDNRVDRGVTSAWWAGCLPGPFVARATGLGGVR